MTIIHCPDCHSELTLPVSPSDAASGHQGAFYCSSCEKTVQPQAPSDEARRVLVVEDTSAVRAILADMLSQAGYRVETAGDGEEALAKIDSFSPHLLLLDLYLPGITGFEVLEALEDRPEEDRPQVLVISGSHEPDSIKKVHALGAAGFIPKSALRDTLLFRVESLFEAEPTAAGA